LLKTFHLTSYGGHCPANLKGIAMEQKITIAATGTVIKEETAHSEHQADDTFGFEAIAPKKGRTPKANVEVGELEKRLNIALENLADCVETLKGLESYGRFNDSVVRRRALECLKRIGEWA
jgi:hypothetical protein